MRQVQKEQEALDFIYKVERVTSKVDSEDFYTN